MDYELISAEEFENLPEDDEQCFVEFESICRRSMTKMLEDDNQSSDYYSAVRGQYMSAVYAVANECGIPNIPNPPVSERDAYESYSAFVSAVHGEVARIRIRNRRSRSALSVQLTDNTRTKIQHYVSRLRDAIQNSDLPDAQKTALRAKLNELEDELRQRRLSLGKTMAVLSFVMVGLAAATTIAADGPKAITHIMQLIGADKQSEDAALSRLAPPPKALPAPPPAKPPAFRPKGSSRDAPPVQTADLDDEIPF
jgi:hypothetical protein